MVYDLLHPSPPLTLQGGEALMLMYSKKINADYLLSFSGANP